MPVREATPQQLAEKALRRAGYSRIRVHRLYPPVDVGEHAEVLFMARERAEGPALPYTAYLLDEEGATPLIAESW